MTMAAFSEQLDSKMPPKKQKQTAHNGFYYFMLEFKENQGKHLRSMKEVADAAGPYWSKMSKDQRKPFDEKALQMKNNMKPGKYTSDGLDIGVIEQAAREEKERIEEMKSSIGEELKFAAKHGTIQDKLFFLIHINSFCYCSSANRYYPAEIGIAAFNLMDGVLPENVYHSMIKPGLLPLGYASEALTISNETHQINPPMGSDGENNIMEVLTTMKQFLQVKKQGSRGMPVLYCHERLMKMTQDILDRWCDDFEEPLLFKVYNLQYMFRVLKNTVAQDNVWPSDTFSTREIEKDVNAYAKGISCDYHDLTNVPIHCSRSIVVRYAYTICDNCCPDLQIQLIPGQHVPQTAFVASTRASSVASVRSSSSHSNAYRSLDEDDTDSVISVSSKSEWDRQSATSDISTINSEDDFPSLGKSKRNKNSSPKSWGFSPKDSSSVYSQSSNRSYAGATGTAGFSRKPAELPSSLTNKLSDLSVGSSSSNASVLSMGRGTSNDFNTGDDFPMLGRGRGLGLRGRGIRRPGRNE